MPSVRSLALLAVGFAAGACDSVPEPEPAPPVQLSVLNRTLGRGADLSSLPSASPDAWAYRLYSEVIASGFPERAARLAREIAQREPDAVTLQEVLTTRTQFPSDADGVPATPNAERVTFDFLATLLDSLAASDLNYRIAAEAETWDAEFAADGVGDAMFDVRFTERTVVLVRDTIQSSPEAPVAFDGAPVAGLTGMGEPVGAAVATLTVGTATVGVVSGRFDAAPERAEAQTRLVADALDGMPFALGASVPERGDETTLAAIGRAGLRDVWSTRGDGDGATCCVGPDIRAPEITLDRRADGIWTRSGQPQTIARFSTTPGIRTASGLWPSARAGLFARVVLGGSVEV